MQTSAVLAGGVDLSEEIEARSVSGAAAKLAAAPGEALAAALMRLSPGFAQDVLGALPDDARERALAAAPREVAAQWQRNAFYEPHAVGRMMEPVVAAYPARQTVGETIERLHELVKTVLVTYIYVVDAEQRLVGVVTMRDLLFNPRERRLEEVMLTEVFALHATAHLEQAMRQVLDRHYPVYPAVDADGRLIGLVRGESMFEAQAIELTLQAGTMVGVGKEERADTSLWQSFRMRHPWLQVNLFTAFATATVVKLYDGTIQEIVVLAAFLPLLSCLAGNNGCQALAVTLRGITLGDLDRHRLRDIVAKEAKLGALNGLFIGIVAGVAMFLFARGEESSPVLLALIMLASMVFACVLSCLLGTLVPMLVRRLGADPATASSLFVLSVTDTLGMLFMLVLATWIAL